VGKKHLVDFGRKEVGGKSPKERNEPSNRQGKYINFWSNPMGVSEGGIKGNATVSQGERRVSGPYHDVLAF